MRTTVRVLTDGKVTIPAQVRDALGLEQGDFAEVDVRPVNATVRV